VVEAMLRGVIFDFDGLLVDTESAAYAAWCEIYARHHVDLDLADWRQCVGAGYHLFDPVAHLTKLTGKEFDRAELMAEKERRKEDIAAILPLRVGALALISYLAERNVPLAIASSSMRDWIEPHLKRFALHPYFKTIVTKDLVTRVKPHPDLPLLAAEKLAILPNQLVVIEDSNNGVRAAKAAGMRAFAVPGPITAGDEFPLADHRFDELTEVLAHFQGSTDLVCSE
jgi:putative hydrolase of the HAD superfamily